ncbi:tetratricopeptide repeat-containing sensor histidine kinase [Hymenobacter convexus]|uniref:tetratricopeptide repeat-containing sensor histidine kinase n=1 Tax=Hymenobacter sp. CA1UV-4 TaxID=3063782 RepID=UPI002712C01A|nr:tetratricopeptide repeat protein [Hymenobacter sp. CA1UV-4]MDO7854741.1 tetratricopeptide repeat protein [Hymenobacter sp. CA1UV-4]
MTLHVVPNRLYWLIGGLLHLAGLAMAQSTPTLPPAPDSLRPALRAAAPGQARAAVLLRIADAYWEPFDSAGLVLYSEAAEREARQARQPVLAGWALDLRGNYYREAGDPPRALQLLLQAGPLLKSAPAAIQANHRYHLGMAYGDLNQPARAFGLYREAAALAGNDADLQAEILNSRGILYARQNQLDSAAVNLYRAVRLHHRSGNQGSEAAALGNLALVYHKQKRWAEAATYTRRGKALETALHDTVALATSWLNLGVIMIGRDSSRAALPCLRLALHMEQQMHLSGLVPLTWNALAKAYEHLNLPDSAQRYYRRVLAMQQHSGSPALVGVALKSLAGFYVRQGQWAQAETYARQVLALPPPHVYATEQVEALEVLRRVAVHRRDFAAAYAWQSRAQHLRDSLRTLSDARVTEEQRARYETDRAEAQVRELTQRQQVADLRRQRQLLGVGLAAVLMLGMGGVALQEYRRRQLRRELALRTRLSADLHDEVGALLTQISMQTDLLEAGVHAPAQQQAQLREVAATSRLAASQLQDVVWSYDARNDAGGRLLDRLRDHAYEALQFSETTITFDADAASEALVLPVETRRAPYLIFKEALANSRKHAPQATHLQVTLRTDRHALTLAIADDGPPPAPNGHAQRPRPRLWPRPAQHAGPRRSRGRHLPHGFRHGAGPAGFRRAGAGAGGVSSAAAGWRPSCRAQPRHLACRSIPFNEVSGGTRDVSAALDMTVWPPLSSPSSPIKM